MWSPSGPERQVEINHFPLFRFSQFEFQFGDGEGRQCVGVSWIYSFF